MKKEDVFYDTDHAEVLSYTEKDEAIEMILSNEPSPLPKEISITKYRRKEISDADVRMQASILETYLEFLDENFGGEDSETSFTKEMEVLYEKFLSEINKLYIVYQCEGVSEEDINCKEWVTKNAPEWINSKDVTFEQDLKKDEQ